MFAWIDYSKVMTMAPFFKYGLIIIFQMMISGSIRFITGNCTYVGFTLKRFHHHHHNHHNLIVNEPALLQA